MFADKERILGKDLRPSPIKYRNCGSYIIELELLDDSVTNELREVCDPENAVFQINKARVLSIYHALTKESIDEIQGNMLYYVGRIITSDSGIRYYRNMNAVYGKIIYKGIISATQLNMGRKIRDIVHWDPECTRKLLYFSS